MAVALSTKEKGSIVKLGGIEHYVVAHTWSGTKLYRKPSIGLVQFDTNGKNVFAPGNASNIAYQMNKGIKAHYNDEAQALIQTSEWYVGSEIDENTHYVSCKLGLLTRSEWMSLGTYYGNPIPHLTTQNEWLITPHAGTSSVWTISENGYVMGNAGANNTTGYLHARPAVIVKSNLMIDDNGNILKNNAPTTNLISPNVNQTLYENYTFNISGTATDADAGNTVTVRYQINAETVRSIKAFVSDGKTVESFAKSLVFKDSKLWDGATAITGNLTDGVAHKLKVWATDDQNGTSTIVERTFYVVPNRAPSLTVDPPVISGSIDNDKFTVNGSYNDDDGNTTTVKYRINGGNSVQVASGTSGVFDFEVSFAHLIAGPNSIVIEAIDSYGAKTSKTVKLNKNVVSTEQLRSTARYKILPPTNKAQAVLLWIERDKDLAIEVAISMTMAGEVEAFVPVVASESVPIAAGSTTYEDTFFHEADAPKDNIIVQIDMTRLSVDANDKITLISGVLE